MVEVPGAEPVSGFHSSTITDDSSSPAADPHQVEGRRRAVRLGGLREDAHRHVLDLQLLVPQPDRRGRHVLGELTLLSHCSHRT